jgi:hypothetical protein
VLEDKYRQVSKEKGETWEHVTVNWDYRGGASVEVALSNGDIVDLTDARETIAACAPEALRMLLDAEYADFNQCETRSCCRWCMALYGTTHADSCPWLALMKKAGVR